MECREMLLFGESSLYTILAISLPRLKPFVLKLEKH